MTELRQIRAADFVAALVNEEASRRSRGVERALLEGSNIVRVGRTVWTVPTWREGPIRRAQIEWLRWRYRRRKRRA